MLISRYRQCTSSENRFLAMARTTGFYMHLPKYWSCRNHDFNSGWQKFADGAKHRLYPRWEERADWWDDHVARQVAAHAACRWPYRHRSYSGYAVYTGRQVHVSWDYQTRPFKLQFSRRPEDRLAPIHFLNRAERKERERQHAEDRIEVERILAAHRVAALLDE